MTPLVLAQGGGWREPIGERVPDYLVFAGSITSGAESYKPVWGSGELICDDCSSLI